MIVLIPPSQKIVNTVVAPAYVNSELSSASWAVPGGYAAECDGIDIRIFWLKFAGPFLQGNQVFICRLRGIPGVDATISATRRNPVSWFTLLAASHTFEPLTEIHLECQSISHPLRTQRVYPDHWDQAEAATDEDKLVIYQSIWVTNLMIKNQCDSWSWKWTKGEQKTWKWTLTVGHCHKTKLLPRNFTWNFKKESFNCTKKLYNCPWVGDLRIVGHEKMPKTNHGKLLAGRRA